MIPLQKPLLPDVYKIQSYLKVIDENKWYTNFGACEKTYRSRLSHLFDASVITASSATSALTATLMAYDFPKGALIAMPSWTFPATAAAVVAAGHIPYFMDVDDNWIMKTPKTAVSAALVVSAFGRPLDIARFDSWDMPVIIDAAAGFDSFSTVCKPNHFPVVVSTHATKAFGTGEGGFVVSNDEKLLEKIRRITNFGLATDRRIEYTGLNAKFSEYHAAVGLAELDGWGEKRKKWLQVEKWYGKALGLAAKDQEWGSSTMLVELEVHAAIVAERMKVKGVEASVARYGCHHHDAYKGCPRTVLPITEALMKSVLMLPCYVDMTREEVEKVVKTLKECL